jgi:hypothetical protein
MAERGQESDHGLAPGGVALVHAAQVHLDEFVQIVHRLGMGHGHFLRLATEPTYWSYL